MREDSELRLKASQKNQPIPPPTNSSYIDRRRCTARSNQPGGCRAQAHENACPPGGPVRQNRPNLFNIVGVAVARGPAQTSNNLATALHVQLAEQVVDM